MRRLRISRARVLRRLAVSGAHEAFTPIASDCPSGVNGALSRRPRRIAGRSIGTPARDANGVARAWLRDQVQARATPRGEGTRIGSPEAGAERGLLALHTVTGALRAILAGGTAVGASATSQLHARPDAAPLVN